MCVSIGGGKSGSMSADAVYQTHGKIHTMMSGSQNSGIDVGYRFGDRAGRTISSSRLGRSISSLHEIGYQRMQRPLTTMH